MNREHPFDWSLARQLATYSEYAYRHATVRDAATDAEALVTLVPGGVVVAFKGSAEPQDFLQDAKFQMELLAYTRHNAAAPCKACVHRGFLEDFSALNVALVAQVRASLLTAAKVSPNPKVYFTGHSLGGALAVLSALEFARQGFPVAAVITFGQPRVGNAAFRDLYNATPVIGSGKLGATLGDITHHVINADDPVPLSPPLLFGYRDEGNEVYLPRACGGGYLVNPSIGLTLFSDVLGAFAAWRQRQLAFLPQHFMKAYLERIQLA